MLTFSGITSDSAQLREPCRSTRPVIDTPLDMDAHAALNELRRVLSNTDITEKSRIDQLKHLLRESNQTLLSKRKDLVATQGNLLSIYSGSQLHFLTCELERLHFCKPAR